MSVEESVRLVPHKDHSEIALIEWDLVGERVNKLNTPVMDRFKELLQELAKSSYKAVVMISRKPNIFMAGADIDEIKSLKKREDFQQAVQGGQEIMNMIEDLPMPVVVAIHGACMGGGCEMSLACDYRILSNDKSTRIGLPEVKLGIIPGFGGCVRLPRVVGLQASLDIILAGKAVNARKAVKIGLADKAVHPAILEQKAVEMALDAAKKGKRKKRFKPKSMMDRVLESPIGRPMVFKQARKTVLKQSGGHYPAPLKALDVVSKTYTAQRAKAMDIECSGFCDVAGSDVSKNLINLFFMMEDVKKKTGVADPAIKPRKVKNMGVLGAGTMGGGIGYVAADVGIDVRMKDLNHDALAKGFQAARSIWDKKLKRRRIDKFELQRKLDHINGGVDFSGFKKMDLVVEAIVEDMGIKQKVIAQTAAECREDAIIATNTSSLSVSEMSKGHPRPENFVGMHFFNPVDKMPLVEVIRGEKTTDEVVATIFDVCKRMGKTPVVVKDGPGFLVNRLLLPLMSEAMFMLSDGMKIETIDKHYKKFGLPMGPFHLMDEVGLDVCVKVLKIFREALGPRIELPPVTDALVKSGRLGKKNGRGFYHYDEKGKKGDVDQSVYSDLGLTQFKNDLDEKEIIERGIFRMINEAALILLEENIVETAQEVDLGMIMGTGFPPFRGGLMKYADTLGSQYIVDELEIYSNKYGARFKPTTPLRNMAKTDRSFYQ